MIASQYSNLRYVRRSECLDRESVAFKASLSHAFQDFCEPFNVDDDTPPFTENNLFPVKIIEIFSHLLARSSYNAGKHFVTDI